MFTNNPPLVPTLSEMNPVHTFSFYFSKIHSNIIFSSMATSSKWTPSFRLSDQNFECTYLSHGAGTAHSIAQTKDWIMGAWFPAGAGIFLFTTTTRLAVGLIQHPMNW